MYPRYFQRFLKVQNISQQKTVENRKNSQELKKKKYLKNSKFNPIKNGVNLSN